LLQIVFQTTITLIEEENTKLIAFSPKNHPSASKDHFNSLEIGSSSGLWTSGVELGPVCEVQQLWKTDLFSSPNLWLHCLTTRRKC